MRIFIDTNKFLDFYRYKEENKEVLDQLASLNNAILTNQVISEFKRNRIAEIRGLLKKIEEKEKTLNEGLCNLEPAGIFTDKIIELNSTNSKLVRKIKSNYQPIKSEINQMLEDENSDIVLETFNKIVTNRRNIILGDDQLAYDLAVKRNKLGGVPRSDKNSFKYLTVCDEYIWENLLLHASDDIIFVTRDETYLANSTILIEEFKEKTGKSIRFMRLISEALRELGLNISKEAIEKEQYEQEKLLLMEALSDVTGVEIGEIEEELLSLSQREEKVIRLRYGLEDGKRYTLAEIGDMFGVSREFIRKIEATALRKMRHGGYSYKPSRHEVLDRLFRDSDFE